MLDQSRDGGSERGELYRERSAKIRSFNGVMDRRGLLSDDKVALIIWRLHGVIKIRRTRPDLERSMHNFSATKTRGKMLVWPISSLPASILQC